QAVPRQRLRLIAFAQRHNHPAAKRRLLITNRQLYEATARTLGRSTRPPLHLLRQLFRLSRCLQLQQLCQPFKMSKTRHRAFAATSVTPFVLPPLASLVIPRDRKIVLFALLPKDWI